MTVSNLPDYNLLMYHNEGRIRGDPWVQVGAGWIDENGRIGIRLNLGTTLDWRDQEGGYIFKLYPNPKKERYGKAHQTSSSTPRDAYQGKVDPGDIPE